MDKATKKDVSDNLQRYLYSDLAQKKQMFKTHLKNVKKKGTFLNHIPLFKVVSYHLK